MLFGNYNNTFISLVLDSNLNPVSPVSPIYGSTISEAYAPVTYTNSSGFPGPTNIFGAGPNPLTYTIVI